MILHPQFLTSAWSHLFQHDRLGRTLYRDRVSCLECGPTREPERERGESKSEKREGPLSAHEASRRPAPFVNLGGTIPFFSEICTFFCTCHNFFPLSSVQIIVAYCVCFKMICKKSLKALFIRRYSQTRKGHSKNGTSPLTSALISRRLELQTPNFLCGLLTP